MSLFVYPKSGLISFLQADDANVTIARSEENKLVICINGAYFIARADEFISVMSVEELDKLREMQKQLEQREEEVRE